MISKERKKVIKKYHSEIKDWRKKILITVISICVINFALLLIFFGLALLNYTYAPYLIFPIITIISSPLIYYLRFCTREYRMSNICKNTISLNSLEKIETRNKLPKTNVA